MVEAVGHSVLPAVPVEPQAVAHAACIVHVHTPNLLDKV